MKTGLGWEERGDKKKEEGNRGREGEGQQRQGMGMGRWDQMSPRLNDHISVTYLTTVSFLLGRSRSLDPPKREVLEGWDVTPWESAHQSQAWDETQA